jgi:MFS family permease
MASKQIDVDRDKNDDRIARERLQVNIICAHMGLNVAGLCVTLVQRVSVMTQRGGLTPAEAAEKLAVFSSGVGALEFLLNPIAGKLSDAIGRKMFLMQAPAVSALLKALVFLRPSIFTVGLERCVAGACTTIGGSTSCGAALADILHDKEALAQANSRLGTATGLGVILGPLLGGWAVGGSGRPERAFAAGAALAALQFACVSSLIKEPLAREKRKEIKREDLLATINPLSFLELFRNGVLVAMLSSISALQCFCEGKSISDLNTYYLLNEAKFSGARRSLFITCLGVVMTISGMVGQHTIKSLGMRGHTTLQNLASAIGFSLMGSSTSAPAIFSVLPIYAFAMERSAAIKSLAVKAADQAGMGKGEYAAAMANLRAIAVGVAPLLYARVYARSLAVKGVPRGSPYFAAALIALICEAMHQTLSDKQLRFSN